MTDTAPDKTIFRRRRSRYTSIANTPLRDKALSLEAVGFLACVMSLPEDWQFNRTWARRRFGVGREKLDRVIKELTAAGYVRREQERYEDGKMGASVYTFTDEPHDFDDAETDEQPLPEKPLPGNPAAGQPAPTKYLLPTNHRSVLAGDGEGALTTNAPCVDRRQEIGLAMKGLLGSLRASSIKQGVR